jgi:hypothetical protein
MNKKANLRIMKKIVSFLERKEWINKKITRDFEFRTAEKNSRLDDDMGLYGFTNFDEKDELFYSKTEILVYPGIHGVGRKEIDYPTSQISNDELILEIVETKKTIVPYETWRTIELMKETVENKVSDMNHSKHVHIFNRISTFVPDHMRKFVLTYPGILNEYLKLLYQTNGKGNENYRYFVSLFLRMGVYLEVNFSNRFNNVMATLLGEIPQDLQEEFSIDILFHEWNAESIETFNKECSRRLINNPLN